MDLFNYYDNLENNRDLNVSRKLLKELRKINQQSYYHNRSRTFSHVLNQFSTSFRYNWYVSNTDTTTNIVHLLSALCTQTLSLLTQTKEPIFLDTIYMSPSDLTSYTGTELINALVNARTNISLKIAYIPRSKTELKQKLAGIPQDNERLKGIENLLIQDIYHLIRVYHIEKTILVITSDITVNMLKMLYAQLPNLLNLVVKPIENLEEAPKSIIQYNQCVTLLRDLFKNFYDSLTQSNFNVDAAHQHNKQILLGLTELLIDDSQAQNTFIQNLANRRNIVQIQRLKNTETDLQNRINSYEADLNRYYERLAQTHRDLLLTKTLTPEDVQPFLDSLISSNKTVEILETSNTDMILRITVPLQYYNPEHYQAYVNNPGSVPNLSLNKREKEILYDTLINKKYAILLQAIIQLTISESDGLLTFKANRTESDFTEMPNPHLYYYNCWSEARSQINKAIANNDYELIIPQILAAVQSVNVAENASFISHFIPDFTSDKWRNKIHFIDNETKEIISLVELLNAPIPEKKEYQQIVLDEEEVTETETETTGE